MKRVGSWMSLIACCLPLACSSGNAESGPIAGAADSSSESVAAVPVRETASAAASAGRETAAEEDAPVRARVMTWDEAQKLVVSRKGRVVVVDVWSTDCVPCHREFPHLVALEKAHGGAVACISINIDFLGIEDEPTAELKAGVLEFLRKQNASTENVICSDAADEVYERVDFVSIPAVYVYDRSGELRKLFKNDAGEYGKAGFTYSDHVSPLVEQLLSTGTGEGEG